MFKALGSSLQEKKKYVYLQYIHKQNLAEPISMSVLDLYYSWIVYIESKSYESKHKCLFLYYILNNKHTFQML